MRFIHTAEIRFGDYENLFRGRSPPIPERKDRAEARSFFEFNPAIEPDGD
jgi:hypothetical protein